MLTEGKDEVVLGNINSVEMEKLLADVKENGVDMDAVDRLARDTAVNLVFAFNTSGAGRVTTYTKEAFDYMLLDYEVVKISSKQAILDEIEKYKETLK